MNNPLLFLLVFVIAALYSSAGFGGASGYLLAMSFFDIPGNVMSSVALVLNIFVAIISFANYFRAGHFRPKLLVPFLITSIPAAFLGGAFKLTQQSYSALLYTALTALAVRMIFFPVLSDKANWNPRPVPLWAALTSGTIIGLLSGMVGIGGGIFLTPLIILLGWGSAKQAAASSGAFIAVNSASGLIGRLAGGSFSLGEFGAPLLAVGLAGALLGSQLGALRLSGANVRRALGIVLLIAVGAYWMPYLPAFK